MKNLFKLNEEEKNRILNLYESDSKKQYLMETPLTDFYNKLPDETSKKFTSMNNSWQGPGTREGDMLNALKTFTANDFNLYNQYLKLHKNSSDPFEYSSFQEIINGEMGKDNLQDVINITNQLKTMGINAEYVKDNIADLHPNSFKINSPVTPVVAKTGTQLDDAWATTYKCVKGQTNKKEYKLKNGSHAYEINGYVYYNNGFKRNIDSNKIEKYTCNEFKKTGVKTIQQTLSPRILNVQKQLGIQNATGKIDVATLQALLTKLNSGGTTPAATTAVASAPVAGTQITNDQLNSTINQLQANANRPI